MKKALSFLLVVFALSFICVCPVGNKYASLNSTEKKKISTQTHLIKREWPETIFRVSSLAKSINYDGDNFECFIEPQVKFAQKQNVYCANLGHGIRSSTPSSSDSNQTSKKSDSKQVLSAQETVDLIMSSVSFIGNHAGLFNELYDLTDVNDSTIHDYETKFKDNVDALKEISDQMNQSKPNDFFKSLWDDFNEIISETIAIDEKLQNWDTNNDKQYDSDEISNLINTQFAEAKRDAARTSDALGSILDYVDRYNKSTSSKSQKVSVKTSDSKTQKEPEQTTSPKPKKESKPTIGQKNALKTAKSYLNYMPFSYSGLVEQLEYEHYTHDEAVYAADNCGADWNEQAALAAYDYLNVMSFSRQGLIEQLEYDGFSYAQALYGVKQNGY